MTLLNRLCRERVARDHEEFTRKRLLAVAESRTSIKLAARSIAKYRHVIPCLKDSVGKKVTSRLGMEAVIKEYERLFCSSIATAPSRMFTPRLENTFPFTPSEVRHAMESMPSGKCSGEDKLVAEDDGYSNCTTTFRPFIRPIVVPIKKFVRQGDPISPNLFSSRRLKEIWSATRRVDNDAMGCITLTSAPCPRSRMLSNTRITQSTAGPGT
ncbi:hypothetical protein ANCDUO_01092 [Ancylostoma duodenale]|uniref:Uncharacterized protein n=1 Tax=Ancylostoma duodenale TaxID=51022 RepID=A0A0C2HG46_9BILA|nr:hypothetical protein ANCDUO_01092 [Ancylostoma duodenale]